MNSIIGENFNLMEIYQFPDKFDLLLKFGGYKIYRIRNTINDKSYIGDSWMPLRFRFFDAWYGGHFGLYEDKTVNVHLYNSMRKYGLENFTLSIISVDETDTEEKFIKIYDSFNNGYNRSSHGLPFNKKSVVKGRIHIYNSNTNSVRTILPEELISYEKLGWEKGQGPSKNREKVCLNKNGTIIMRELHEVEHYINQGYSISNGLIWIMNESLNQDKLIHSIEFDKYSAEGWICGRIPTTQGKVTIHKNGEGYKYIFPEDLVNYVNDGWERSNPLLNKISVVNYSKRVSKYINESELSNYVSIGYSQGTGLISINNGNDTKKIYSWEFEEYEKLGWTRGRLSLQGRIRVVNESNESRMIKLEDVPYFKSIGYIKRGLTWNTGNLIE